MSTEKPKEHEDVADKRQGGNLETKGASKMPLSERAEKNDAQEQPSGEKVTSSGEVDKKA